MRGGELSGHFISLGAGPDESGYPFGPAALPGIETNWAFGGPGDPGRFDGYTVLGPELADRPVMDPNAAVNEIVDGVFANRAAAAAVRLHDPSRYAGWIDL
ncbi:MAG TPA: hypothetical protein VF466_03730 [Candidatus Saccharimonadales bacterium]